MNKQKVANLADLPKAERDAIQQDKERWYKARQWIAKGRAYAVAELNKLNGAERDDMRRRLNYMRGRRVNE